MGEEVVATVEASELKEVTCQEKLKNKLRKSWFLVISKCMTLLRLNNKESQCLKKNLMSLKVNTALTKS